MARLHDDLSASATRANLTVVPSLATATVASIGAGVIHAAAIGAHNEHRQAVVAFTIVAIVQIAWAVLALIFPSRLLALFGAAVNAALVVGWVLAKTSEQGISFVNGLDAKEPVQFADGAAAALAGVAVLAALFAASRGVIPRNPGHSTFGVAAVVTSLVAVPAMVSAGGHSHGHGHDEVEVAAGGGKGAAEGAAGHVHGADAGPSASGGTTHAHEPAVVPPKPYDPSKPIDLGGVPGVTPEQQARAENLIAVTLVGLPQWSDYKVAEAHGFFSIGDAVTGDEHYINLKNIFEPGTFDPDHPESLVYQPDGKGGKKLAAAMYMLPPGTTLDDVPNIGGKLMQWHVHNNLCFTAQGKVAGITPEGGRCKPPLNDGIESPMIHIWIRKHPCGPFAALEGVGGGQIKAGETRLCDTAHGSH